MKHNNMKRKMLLVLLALMMVSSAFAQTMSRDNEYLFRVKRDGLYGYINAKGAIVIPMQYQMASEFSEGYAVVIKNDTPYIINLQGKQRMLAFNIDVFGIVDLFKDGMAIIQNWEDQRYGYMDTTGRIIIDPLFDDVGEFSEDLAAVNLDGRVFYIDKTGKPTIMQVEWLGKKYNIAQAGMFSEGLAVVRVEDDSLYYGYIDKNGKMLIDPLYWYAGKFQDGMAIVRAHYLQKYGYINHSGRYAVKPVYDAVYPYVDGVACAVEFNGDSRKIVLLDIKGERIGSLDGMRYSLQAFPTDGRIVVTHDDDGGVSSLGITEKSTKDYLLYDFSMKMDNPIASIKAESMTGFDHGLARFFLNDTVYYVNTDGNYVFASAETSLRMYNGNLLPAAKEVSSMILSTEPLVDEDEVLDDDENVEVIALDVEEDEDENVEVIAVDVEEDEDEDENEIFQVVEEAPQFPGGEEALYKYLQENILYPVVAKNNRINGRVYVSFVVEKDGRLTEPRLLRDIGGGCGAEAIRVVKSMPRWIPGKNRGKTVRTQYNLPVSFVLPDQE